MSALKKDYVCSLDHCKINVLRRYQHPPLQPHTPYAVWCESVLLRGGDAHLRCTGRRGGGGRYLGRTYRQEDIRAFDLLINTTEQVAACSALRGERPVRLRRERLCRETVRRDCAEGPWGDRAPCPQHTRELCAQGTASEAA